MLKPYLLPSNKSFTRVRRQLVEAMIFEGLIQYTVVENNNDKSVLSFYLYGKKHNFRCKGRKTSFDRIHVKEDSIFMELQNQQLIEAPIEALLDEIEIDPQSKETILKELWQTVKFCEWNVTNLKLPFSRRESCFEELESEIIEGHLYHPCFKSRTGFSLDDHERYGPEAKQTFSLIWVAIRRNKMRVSLFEREADFWKRELGQILWERLLEELEIQGGTFEEYVFLPIHPWQFKSIQPFLQEGIHSNEMIILNVVGDHYRATQSIRTLWNKTNPDKAYLKLSMNLVNTSSLRILDSHSVCAAPTISAWLEEIINSDPYLKHDASLVILKEYAGIIYDSEESKAMKLSGHLGAIWRESINKYLEEDEEAVPFTALLMMEKDGFPFITHWIKQYGIKNWLTRLFEVSIVPVWHFLIAHGIALEAHAQNMILLHKNGWPTRIVLRDFHDSIEFTKEFLAKEILPPDFGKLHNMFKDAPENQFYWMASVEDLRELIMDTLFVFHFSELSFLLDEEYQYKEEEFWNQVDQVITSHLNRFPELKNRHEQVQHSRAQIYVESLLTKKLRENKESESFRHTVRNVFAHLSFKKEK
ncbi:IucA/IucC family protein [Metabacillus litoralis]|uniref:IucA/IucC family protein n=1 Tax=Metabacillus litoralis TaxID=152268 RepID=UPI001CFD5BE2|nr:IucA/IucC family protein [Metabacillus litoralis]